MAREQWSDEVLFDPRIPTEGGGAEDTGGDTGGSGGYSPPGDEAAKTSYFNKLQTGATSGIPGKTGWHQTLGTLMPVEATQWGGIDPASLLKNVMVGDDTKDDEGGGLKPDLPSTIPELRPPITYPPSIFPTLPDVTDDVDDTKEEEEGNGEEPDLPPDWWEAYAGDSGFLQWLEETKGYKGKFGHGDFDFGSEDKDAWSTYWDEYQAFLTGEGADDDEEVIITDDPDDFDPFTPDDPSMDGDKETNGTGGGNGFGRDSLLMRGLLGGLGGARPIPWYDKNTLPSYMQPWQNLPTATPRRPVDKWSRLGIPTPPSSIYEQAPGLNFQDLMSNWAGYTPQAGGGGGLPFYSQGSMQELLRRLGGR